VADAGGAARGVWADDSGGGHLGVPEGVRHVVARRIARLSGAADDLLRAGAAFPQGFELRVLQAVLGFPDAALLDALDETLRAGFLRPEAGPGERYGFTHAIVRHALYEELSPSRRARLHRRIGEVLVELYAPDVEFHLAELAHHFSLAVATGDTGKALRYATGAAELAVRCLAFKEAVGHYQHALRLLESRAPAGPSTWARLTRREHDVTALIARGLTNRQIAEILVIGERTVEMHVSNVLGKLGLASRAQVAVWAVEQRIAGAGPDPAPDLSAPL
jgi:DNA-binding CsgD family transcriptional regulator